MTEVQKVTEPPPDAAVGKAPEAITTQTAGELSSPKYVDGLGQAMAKMDRRMDDDKLNLSTQELGQVKAVEQAVVKSDPKALGDELAKLGSDPILSQKLMDVATKDLAAAGIDARWTYTSKISGPGYGQGYYLRGHEDIGHLTLAKDNSDGTFTSATFSTEGAPSAIRRPIPTADGRDSALNPSPENPSQALRDIAALAKSAKV